jgi:tetratricopeptide (TPR) repeat protein
MKLRRPTCALFALLLGAIACNRDPEVVKKKYVERGNEYFKNSKFKEASIMYRSALKKDLKYGEAYYRLGLTDIKLGAYGEALNALHKAAELQPENDDARSQLADIYLMAYLGDPKRPKTYLDELQELSKPLLKKDPNSFLGLRIQGYLSVAARDLPAALESFTKANTTKPFAPEVILPLVQTLAALNRFDEAEKLAKEALVKDKTYSAMYDWLYAQYVARNRLPDAEKLYQSKVANNPKVADFAIQLAGHYFAAQKRDDMVRTLQTITANQKEVKNAHQMVGDFYMRVRDVDRALLEYQEGLKSDPERKTTYQKRMVEAYVMTGKKQEALALVNDVLKEDPKDNEATAMRAALWLQDGDKLKVQAAITDLLGAVQRNPDNFVLRYNLGQAFMARGDMDQARIQFQEAVKHRADYTPARLQLADIALKKSEFSKALSAADEIIQYDPNNYKAKLIRTSAKVGMGDTGNARKELMEILAANPRSSDAQFQLGLVNFQEGKLKDAEEWFRKLHQETPADPRGLIGIVETYVSLNKFDQALAMLQEELRKAPERSNFRMALANTAVRAAKYDLAITEYSKLLEAEPRSYDVLLRLGETYRFNNQIDKAIETFKKAKEVNPNDTQAYLRIALLYEDMSRRQESRPIYEQILKMEPDNAIALNNLAYMIADNGGDLDQALTYAQRAKAKVPTEPNIADTLGWIYIKKNLSDNAITVFRDLTTKYPDKAVYHYHLAMALYQKGEKPEAKRSCETALKNKPSKDEEQRIRELIARIGP